MTLATWPALQILTHLISIWFPFCRQGNDTKCQRNLPSVTQQTAGPPPQHPKGLFPSSFSNRSHTWGSLPHEAAPFWLQTWVRILEFLFSNRSPLTLLSRRVYPLLRTPEVPWDLHFNFSMFKPLTCSLWRRPQKCSLLRLHLIKPRRRKLNLWNRRCDSNKGLDGPF